VLAMESGIIQFTRSDQRIQTLLQTLHAIADLKATKFLLGWDQQTTMPHGCPTFAQP